MVVAALAAIVFGAVTAVREVVGDDAPAPGTVAPVERTGSRRAGPTPAPEPLAHTGAGLGGAYRVTYLVSAPGSESVEVWTVRPPFDARVLIRRGSSDDGEVLEEREQALGVLASKRAGQDPVVLAPPPAAAGMRPGPVVADAVVLGLLEVREQRVVAGRRCQVYRTGAESGGTTFTRPPAGGDHVDLCIDGDGLLLELLERFEGRNLRQRVARRVEPDAAVAAAELAQLGHEPTLRARDGGGSVRRVDPATQPVGPFLVVAAAPEGFAPVGRFEVVPPQPELRESDTRGRAVAATSDVYVRGADVVVVERGARLDLGEPWEPSDAYPDRDLGPVLGTGEVLVGTTGAEVRALLDRGRYVRVYGTGVRLATLEALARSLTVDESGTGPRYLD